MQIDCEKLTLIFCHSKFSYHTARQQSVIGVKKLHINSGSKMEVYCMNWVSLNRRLFDSSFTLCICLINESKLFIKTLIGKLKNIQKMTKKY